MKTLAIFLIFIYAFITLPYASESACCNFDWHRRLLGMGGRTCFCYIFNCHCADCPTCSAQPDTMCHYEDETGNCVKSSELAGGRSLGNSKVSICYKNYFHLYTT